MYNPKIKEEFIPEIYRIARTRGIHMTTLVNEIIEKALDEMVGKNSEGISKQGMPEDQAPREEE